MTPTTHSMWRDLIEIAMTRQAIACELALETVELHGPTSRRAAVAYAHWYVACERHEAEERNYQDWLRESRRAAT